MVDGEWSGEEATDWAGLPSHALTLTPGSVLLIMTTSHMKLRPQDNLPASVSTGLTTGAHPAWYSMTRQVESKTVSL